jgi:hypothetical protein
MPKSKKTISESVTESPTPTVKEPTEQKKAKAKKTEWKDEPPKYEAKFGKFIVKFD